MGASSGTADAQKTTFDIKFTYTMRNPIRQVLSSVNTVFFFTCHYVVLNLYDYIYSMGHKLRIFEGQPFKYTVYI